MTRVETVTVNVPKTLYFTVDHLPAPQGSKKHVGNGVMVEDSKRLPAWRRAVWAAAFRAAKQADEFKPFTGAVHVEIIFRYPRPKSHYRTGRFSHLLKDDAPHFVTTTPDIDKTCRSVFDAITASGVWKDDRQAAALVTSKVYGETPGASIYLSEITNTSGERT